MEELVMTDDMEIDYATYYIPDSTEPSKSSSGKPKSISSTEDSTREGQVFNMMSTYNLGTTMVSIIPDKVLTIVEDGKPGVPRLYRKVQFGYDGRIATADNDKLFMNIQIPRVSDFLCPLTKEQSDLINKLRTQCKNFSQFVSYMNKGKFVRIQNLLKKLDCRPQTVYMYGKLIKVISKDKGEIKSPEIGHVRVLKFDKGKLGESDVVTALKASISNKCSALGSSAWMKDYFSRNTGTRSKVTSFNISQSSGKVKTYSLNASLEEVAPFEITEQDINIADNLNSRVFDITKFDVDYYTRLDAAFNRLQSVIDSMSS